MKKHLVSLLIFSIPFICLSEELPSEFKNNLIYLKPKLADGTTLTFFTDTGGGWNAISRELSEKYGWEISQKESENGVIEVTDMPQFDPEASIPMAGLNNWWAGKLQVVPSEEFSSTTKSDGTLGGRWHAEKVIDFNYPEKKVEVLDETPTSTEFSTVPLGFQKGLDGGYTMAFPSIDISVNDRQIPMLLDSGASAWPSTEAMEKGGLEGGQVATSFIVASIFDEWVKSNPEWLVIEDACNFSHQPMIRVPYVRIGNKTVGPVWFTRRADSSFHQFMSSMMDRRIDGALGGSALQYLRLIVDYPNEQALIANEI